MIKDELIEINKKDINISSQRLNIRILTPEDVTDEYVNGLNDSEVNHYLVARMMTHTRESCESYIKQSLESENDLFFGIFLNENGRLIGTIRASLWSYHYIAGLGIMLFSKEHFKKGYGSEALNVCISFLFDGLNLRCIDAQAHCENEASVKLFLKCDFEIQEKIVNKYRHEDKFVDIYVFNRYNPSFKDDEIGAETPNIRLIS